MSNCYDIDIKLNYFESGSSYEDMLENKKSWESKVSDSGGLCVWSATDSLTHSLGSEDSLSRCAERS